MANGKSLLPSTTNCLMMGLGMGGAPFERSGCAMKVVEPAGHRGALVGGNCGLCRLEIEERGRRCLDDVVDLGGREEARSEEHTSELQSLMRISSAVFCLN